MSKLLIPGHGAPSARVQQPGGGLVLAPDASRIASMRYGIKGGCMPYGLTAANGQDDVGVVGLFFPTTNNSLFATNIAAQALGLSRLISAAGLLITGDDVDENGQTISPYYQTADVSADKEEGINSFTVGTASEFYMKATIQVSSIAANKIMNLFVGFAEAAVHVIDNESLTESYGFSVGDRDGNDGSIFEQKTTGAAETLTDTATALVIATNTVIEIKVSAAGVATMTIDNVDQTKTTKTFAAGTVLRPIIYTRVGSSTGSTQHLSAFEFGYTNARK